MKLLLDTHAFLWLLNDDYDHLRGKTAKKLFLDENNRLFFSLASVWEMAIKISLGKLNIEQRLTDFIPEQLAINDITLLAIDFLISKNLPLSTDAFIPADCRYPGYRDVTFESHPWLLGSGNPCRNDEN